MIRIKDLYKSFDGTDALNGVSFTVPKGSVTGLVGPNGAGKSTLLRHISGIYRQNKGEVLVNGEPVYDNIAVKNGISFIPDNIYSFSGMSTADMRRYFKGMYPGFDSDLFDRLAGAFPAVDLKKTISRMSKGMQKQAMFLLAVSARPQVLLLDEPVDGLDPITRKTVWSIILNEVAGREMTVLVSSHNLRELEDVCDRVVIMDKGRVVLESAVSDLQKDIFKIQAAFDGEVPALGGLDIVSRQENGRIVELVVRGDKDVALGIINAAGPLFADVIPMTLEEIFINELGGDHDEIRKILF